MADTAVRDAILAVRCIRTLRSLYAVSGHYSRCTLYQRHYSRTLYQDTTVVVRWIRDTTVFVRCIRDITVVRCIRDTTVVVRCIRTLQSLYAVSEILHSHKDATLADLVYTTVAASYTRSMLHQRLATCTLYRRRHICWGSIPAPCHSARLNYRPMASGLGLSAVHAWMERGCLPTCLSLRTSPGQRRCGCSAGGPHPTR